MTLLYRRVPALGYTFLALTVPPATAALAIYTIYTCAMLTFEAGILPNELKFPPISMFGLRKGSAEQTLYMWGMSLIFIINYY